MRQLGGSLGAPTQGRGPQPEGGKSSGQGHPDTSKGNMVSKDKWTFLWENDTTSPPKILPQSPAGLKGQGGVSPFSSQAEGSLVEGGKLCLWLWASCSPQLPF